METPWEQGLSSQPLPVLGLLARLQRRPTQVYRRQDGISCSSWMDQLHLTLNGCESEEIHRSWVFGQIYPVSRLLVSSNTARKQWDV